jgi:endonuclease/exonuclease/phosphatase family metal-dependent hydrolase
MKRAVAQAVLGACVVAGCSSAIRPVHTSRIDLSSHAAASCRAESAAQPGAARVRWIGPVESRERTRLDRWCAGVGPALLRDEPATAEARLDDVMFVSWNVHVGHAEIQRFVRDLRSGKLSEGRRPNHLVLMLQEAMRSGEVPDAIPETASTAGRSRPADADAAGIGRIAEQLNMSLVYVPSMRDGAVSNAYSPADRGNAILSTVPLSEPTAIELPGDGQRRVAITATMPITVGSESMRLSIGAAHLSTRATSRTLWVFGAANMRRLQARSLAAALPASGPLIMGADLNSWMGGPNEPAARDLMRAFPSTPGGHRQPTASAGLVLDYMFFRPPSGWHPRMIRGPERYGSDHYPLIGWLEP